jgi:hypothetical protein
VTLALAGWTTPGTAAVPDAALTAGAALRLGAALAVDAARWVTAACVCGATPGTTASPAGCVVDAVGESSVSFDGAAAGEDEGDWVPDGLTVTAPDAADVAFGAAVVPSSEAVARCPLSTKPTTPSTASVPP